MQKTILKNYAKLLAKTGLNVQKGQDVIITADISQAEFVLSLLRKYGLDFSYIYPWSARYECAVRNRNAIVIGPEGELYKCWQDVGCKDKVVGFPTLLEVMDLPDYD